MVYYSASAYAQPNEIMSWNFSNPELNGNLSSTFKPILTFSPSSETSSAFAYIGVDTDRKEIVVAFRGTSGTLDMLHDLVTSLGSVFHYIDQCELSSTVKFNIHKGICWYYQSLRDSGLIIILGQVRQKFPDCQVIATGHSLGGALASIFALHVSLEVKVPIKLYTFGGPRVGDTGFAKALDSLGIESWRVVHWKDVVVHLAPCCSGFWGTSTCDADSGGCPFHFGGEAWYADDMNSAPMALCDSGENVTCSGSVGIDLYEGVQYHVYYFGVRVGTFSRKPDAAREQEQERELAAYLAAHGSRPVGRRRRPVTP